MRSKENKKVPLQKESTLFTSSREKYYWIWAFAVTLAIFSVLFVGNPLASQLRNQNVQAIFFISGLLLVAAAVIVHGLKTKPSKIELSIILGIVAVYTMFIFRLGAPERSHLIEYSVLAIFIHKALIERKKNGRSSVLPALLALIIAFLIGVLDEVIQIFLPNRVFDLQDILFNGMAVIMAISTSLLLTWVRKRINSAKM